MPKPLRVLLTAAFLFCAAAPAFPAGTTPRYIVDKVWTTDDKVRTADERLPQNAVIAMTQTRDGYLWLGTGDGLARFDGIHFKTCQEKEAPELANSKIVRLFEDRERNLWVGTEAGGVFLINPQGKVTRLVLGPAGTGGPLREICEDGIGGVWLGMADGRIHRYWNGRPSLVAEKCRGLVAEDSGVVWVGTPDGRMAGLGPISKSAATAIPVSFEVPVGRLDFLLASAHGGYWRLANGRVQKCKADRVTRDLGQYPWSSGVPILAACEDREGNLIVGTYGDGVYWFDSAGHATRLQGVSHGSIWCLVVDREGCLWVGTNGGGLNRVKRQVFDVLESTEGRTVQSVCEDHQGGLWIGYNGERVDHWSGGASQQFTDLGSAMLSAESARVFVDVRAVLEDQRRQVWVGVASTPARLPCLLRFRDGRFEFLRPSIVNRDVAVIHQDRQTNVWVGSQAGLARWDGHGWKEFTTRDGLSAPSVRALADDAEGNLWIGTERGGLDRFRNGQFTAFRRQEKDGLPSDDIASLCVDKAGVLWIGTSSGLVRYQAGKWTRFTTEEGLASNKIGYLIEDGRGNLWIGSNAGLMRVSLEDLNKFSPGKMLTFRCRTFGHADGLPAGECTFGSQPGACRTRDGKLWFSTIKGLAFVDPAAVYQNTNLPPVVIEAVKIDGELQTPGTLRAPPLDKVTVRPGREVLEIDYTSLNLSAPEQVRFKYRLAGHESDWTPAGDVRVARYSKLPAGDYRFQVQACNEDGIWNEAGCTLQVSVLPPFWKTWWFLSLAAVVVLGLIVGSVHYVSTQRLQRQLAALRQQEALEKERARIARDLHDQLGANLTQVALLGEMAETDKDLPREVEAHARQIAQTARETTRALDEIVWTVNPSNDTLDGLINYICKYAQEYLALAGLKYRLEVPPQLPGTPISPELRHNVFLAAKEAVNNVVKHSGAASAWVRLRLEPGRFTLEIEDDGRGVSGLDEQKGRNGLRNMRKRMEDIGGGFELTSGANGGARVRLTAPLQNSSLPASFIR